VPNSSWQRVTGSATAPPPGRAPCGPAHRSTEGKPHIATKQPVGFALIAALTVLCLASSAPAALAGKGKPQKPSTGSGGTISLVLVNSTDGLA